MRRSISVSVVLVLAACSGSSSSTTSGTGQAATTAGTASAATSAGATTSAGPGSTSGATSAAAATSGATSAAATSGVAAASTTGASAAVTTGATSGATTSATASSTTSSTGGSTTSGGAAITVDNFDHQVSLAFCTSGLTCEAYADEIITDLCPLFPTLGFEGLPAAVDAGRVTFDAAKAATCLASLQDAGCRFSTVLTSACTSVTTGTEPADAGCFTSFDCADGDCASTASCSPGACFPYVESGGDCSCANCLCDPAGALTCLGGVCAPPGQEGAACGSGDATCGSGLDCVNDICAALPVAPGNPCTGGDVDCQAGSYCFTPPLATFGSCALQAALGQPCGQDIGHQANVFGLPLLEIQCAGGASCVGAGTLMDSGVQPGVCTVYSDVGGPCVAASAFIEPGDTYNDGCKLGLNCVAGICTTPPQTGTCSSLEIPCDGATSYCDSTTNTCQPIVPQGGACDGDVSQCGLLANCNSDDICEAASYGCDIY